MSELAGRARRGENLDDLDIVDVHGHLGRYEFPVPDLTAEGLVRVMDRIGVRQVMVSHLQCIQGHTAFGNDEVLAAMRTFPERILGYVTLFPSDAEVVRAEMTRCVDSGFVGLKMHISNGFPYTHANYAPALAIANERRMPVLLHAWGDENSFSQARELAGRYPQISLLLAHSGSTNPQGYVRIAMEVANIYLDTCLSRAPRGLIDQLVAGAGADNVVWGSDCYFMSMTQQIGAVLGAKIADDDKRKLLSLNARKILSRIVR